MNLADILIPKPRYCTKPTAESADCAERPQPLDLDSPHINADTCGKGLTPAVIRTIPQTHAETEPRATITFPHNPHNPPTQKSEIENPLPVTLEYFRAEGVELLREDLAFLRWYLPKTTQRNAFIRQYLITWHEAMAQEQLPHRSQNTGRREANTWLRNVVTDLGA